MSLALLGPLLYPKKKKRIQKKVTYKSIIKNLDLRNIVEGEEGSLKCEMTQYLKSWNSLHSLESNTPFAGASSLYELHGRDAEYSSSLMPPS